eukprot:307235-Prymnesium_polylepis.1
MFDVTCRANEKRGRACRLCGACALGCGARMGWGARVARRCARGAHEEGLRADGDGDDGMEGAVGAVSRHRARELQHDRQRHQARGDGASGDGAVLLPEHLEHVRRDDKRLERRGARARAWEARAGLVRAGG